MTAVVQPNSLGNAQKIVNKTFGTNGRPTGLYICFTCKMRTHCVSVMSVPLTPPTPPDDDGKDGLRWTNSSYETLNPRRDAA